MITRLLYILSILHHGPVNAKELAELCQVSQRTIHRDIKRLDDAGVQVFADRQGYYVIDSPSDTFKNIRRRVV